MRKILNVGCGNQTYGTHFVDKYPKRKGVIKCDIERGKLPFKSNQFDEVYSRCLFEHLKNPFHVLKEMHRILKPKGRLILITDNAGFWGFHMPMSKTHYGGYEKHGSYGKEDKHFMLFTAWHLENYFKELKIKITRINYEYDDNPSIIVRAISELLNMIGFSKVAFPRIKIEGVK